MRVYQTLICFIVLTLQDGITGRVDAETNIYRRREGENITVECKFVIPGTKSLFCKEKCEEGNILIETSEDTAEHGRYSVKFVKNNFWERDLLYVSITQLQMSDSGLYRCSLDTSLSPHDFHVIVTGASTTSAPSFTSQPVSSSTFLLSASTTKQHLISSLENSTPSSASTEPMNQTDPLLYVGVILVVMITFLSVALLIFCKQRKDTKPKGPPVETEYANVRETSRLYENITEMDRLNSSPVVEVFSVYTTAKCPQEDRVQSSDLYSLTTSPQNKAEDDLNEVAYSVVDFSHIPDTNSAPCGNANDVIYSTPLVDGSTANHTKGTSPPLYSVVKKHQ